MAAAAVPAEQHQPEAAVRPQTLNRAQAYYAVAEPTCDTQKKKNRTVGSHNKTGGEKKPKKTFSHTILEIGAEEKEFSEKNQTNSSETTK
jgi:hypothetical protein